MCVRAYACVWCGGIFVCVYVCVVVVYVVNTCLVRGVFMWEGVCGGVWCECIFVFVRMCVVYVVNMCLVGGHIYEGRYVCVCLVWAYLCVVFVVCMWCVCTYCEGVFVCVG